MRRGLDVEPAFFLVEPMAIPMFEDRNRSTLPWAERPLTELLRLAWPMAVSMLSYVLMTLVDTLFVGRLGSAALAGVGLSGALLWTLICFPFGMLQGAKLLVSQSIGAGQGDRVGGYWQSAQVWSLGLAVVTVAAGLAVGTGLSSLSATPAAAQAATEYFHLRLVGLPVILVFCAAREVRQGLGDSRSPMVASVVANAINIGLDYLLVIHLGWGVAGAAIATVLANVVEVSVMLAVMVGDSRCAGALRPRQLAAIWRLGWPTGLQMVVEMSCFTVMSVMISRFSAVHMAAQQITIQVIHFSFLPALALGEACSVLVGQAVGAGQRQMVRRLARVALTAGGIYSGLCGVAFVAGGGLIASGFTGEEDLHALVVSLLVIAAIFQVFDAANIIARCALRGTGDVRWPAMVGILLAWISAPPAMWILGYGMNLGVLGGWIGLCLELVVSSALFWWRLERDGWHRASMKAEEIRANAA